MPLEFGIWRIDQGLQPVEPVSLDLESRLEDILDQDISIAAPNWMIIGRQVRTSYDKYIDLLAIDRDGNLVVIELKRDKTYRDIVAQVLDYGSWVRSLRDDDIAQTFQAYLKRYHPERQDVSINEAFCERFGVPQMPDELNESHELVVVASSLDPSTERVVGYLAEEYDVKINVIFFRVFKDEGREYLGRAWLREPTITEIPKRDETTKGEWNGEYYVSFGVYENRRWEEGVKYGFISGGGGAWYTNTLSMLEPGARVWVNVPGKGYVGVGRVVEAAKPIDEFFVKDESGREVSISSLPLHAAAMTKVADNPDKAEYMVRVEWLKTVPLDQAVKEKGFFGNQNTVARPVTPKWDHTIERLKKRFGIE